LPFNRHPLFEAKALPWGIPEDPPDSTVKGRPRANHPHGSTANTQARRCHCSCQPRDRPHSRIPHAPDRGCGHRQAGCARCRPAPHGGDGRACAIRRRDTRRRNGRGRRTGTSRRDHRCCELTRTKKGSNSGSVLVIEAPTGRTSLAQANGLGLRIVPRPEP